MMILFDKTDKWPFLCSTVINVIDRKGKQINFGHSKGSWKIKIIDPWIILQFPSRRYLLLSIETENYLSMGH